MRAVTPFITLSFLSRAKQPMLCFGFYIIGPPDNLSYQDAVSIIRNQGRRLRYFITSAYSFQKSFYANDAIGPRYTGAGLSWVINPLKGPRSCTLVHQSSISHKLTYVHTTNLGKLRSWAPFRNRAQENCYAHTCFISGDSR